METTYISLDKIEHNRGQLEGLPANPRTTTEERIQKLMKSIQEDEAMLELRPLMVYPLANGRYLVIGGNMRLEALRRLGRTETPCTIIARDTPTETLKRYLAKDNASFGDWDWQQLKEGWDTEQLMQWDIMPPFQTIGEPQEQPEQPQETIRKRKQWKSERQAGESVCDLEPRPQLYQRHGTFFIASFRKTEKGVPISQCKQADMVDFFAESAEALLHGIITIGSTDGWALVTTPRRRHKQWNLADEVCKRLAQRTGITYHPDIAEAKNRHRINPELRILKQVDEKNVVIYDDILTTGSTLQAMRELLEGKNIVAIIGINNN